tara:strand:+ start:96379 stop:96852 length:474 start_codon:yes stop_codon:yes gene_type:complete
MSFQIYKPEYNPSDLTGQVGGNIGSEILSGYINELFQHISSPPSGLDTTSYQYRKVFIKNEHTSTSTNTRVWVDAIEHVDQISLAESTGVEDSSTSSTGEPVGISGWRSSSNYAEGVSLGTLTSNAYSGVWIRQALSGVSTPDPYATFRIYVGGIVQ